ncbi:MAG: response regulator transcription factor [Proteobacteria bacterium]|nr:response regulator transcription factor [Pseudomonadota bacterium]
MKDGAQRALVVDAQLLARIGMAALLDGLPGWTCAGAVADVDAALQACRERVPDVVLLDLLEPGAGSGSTGANAAPGLDLAQALRRQWPRLRILVVSARAEPALVRAALRAGADGFMGKRFERLELVQALDALRQGRRWISPPIQAALQAAERSGPALTPRQRDVLAHLARGRSNKQIARDLGISIKTVEYHRAEVIARLDLHDVASLTRYALAQGLVDAVS